MNYGECAKLVSLISSRREAALKDTSETATTIIYVMGFNYCLQLKLIVVSVAYCETYGASIKATEHICMCVWWSAWVCVRLFAPKAIKCLYVLQILHIYLYKARKWASKHHQFVSKLKWINWKLRCTMVGGCVTAYVFHYWWAFASHWWNHSAIKGGSIMVFPSKIR